MLASRMTSQWVALGCNKYVGSDPKIRCWCSFYPPSSVEEDPLLFVGEILTFVVSPSPHTGFCSVSTRLYYHSYDHDGAIQHSLRFKRLVSKQIICWNYAFSNFSQSNTLFLCSETLGSLCLLINPYGFFYPHMFDPPCFFIFQALCGSIPMS